MTLHDAIAALRVALALRRSSIERAWVAVGDATPPSGPVIVLPGKPSVPLDETGVSPTWSTGWRLSGWVRSGKRRLRCLTALGETRLVGVDPRPDRRDEVAEGLGIPTYDGLEAALEAGKVGVLCISVPPHLHLRYLREAVERRLPAFVEAGVVAGGLKEVAAAAREAGVQLVPSNTMLSTPRSG